MKATLATVTLARDSAKYIVPHLRMYTGVDKNFALFVDKPIEGGSVGHGEPDNTEELIRTHCPDVEIHHTDENKWGSSIFNQMIELAKDYDKVVMFHADVVMDAENWERFRKYVLETDFDVYKLDMTKCTINYYHDFEHGLRDCEDIEPVAVKSTTRFDGIYTIAPNAKVDTIDWMTVHHFTGWKGIFTTKEWLEGKVPSESRRYIHDMTTEWTPCPEHIRAMFL
jgi:hypothetical protein